MGVVFFLAFMIIAVVYVVLGAYVMIYYVVQGVTCIKISQKLGVSKGWMGFIPFACYYLVGKLAEEDNKRYSPEKKGKKWRVLYPAALGAYYVLTVVAGIFYYAALILAAAITDAQRARVLLIVLMAMALLAFLAGLVLLMVMGLIVIYKLYHAMAGKNAWWMLLLTALVPLAQQVILLVLAFSKKYPQELAAVEAVEDVVPPADALQGEAEASISAE
ncbi:MAG: hypothetical protein IJX08_05645 [Clostridia bacterium]|nr:hypothetical protein [Clostridia bacterium]